MELDDLKSAWQSLNGRMDQQAALNLQTLKEARLDKTRRGLRPLAWGQGFGMAVGAVLALASATFWVDHRQVPHLLIPGIVMHAYGLAMILCGARMQLLIARIDYGAPVVEIQRRLAELRRFYVRSGKWIGLPWFVLWVPFMQITFMGLFGADLYQNTKAGWFFNINLAAGAALWLLMLALDTWAHGRPGLAGKVDRALAGRSLNRAQQELEALAKFEQE